jgi:hypothetical protein
MVGHSANKIQKEDTGMVLANDAFRFLKDLPSRPKKPREHGITMMIDWGIGLRHQQDYLDSAGE